LFAHTSSAGAVARQPEAPLIVQRLDAGYRWGLKQAPDMLLLAWHIVRESVIQQRALQRRAR
jgi:hypothetical protein